MVPLGLSARQLSRVWSLRIAGVIGSKGDEERSEVKKGSVGLTFRVNSKRDCTQMFRVPHVSLCQYHANHAAVITALPEPLRKLTLTTQVHQPTYYNHATAEEQRLRRIKRGGRWSRSHPSEGEQRRHLY